MKTNTLSAELLHKMDAYRRAANYLSVRQIYLYDNPLLKRPLALDTAKEEGTITTPFDMTVLNDLDRFHLVMDSIDRLPQTGDKGI